MATSQTCADDDRDARVEVRAGARPMMAASVSRSGSRLLSHAGAVAVATVMFALIYDPFHAGAIAFLALAPITLVFTDPRIGCSFSRAATCGFAFGLLSAMAIVGPWMFSASVDYFDRSGLWSLGFTLLVNALYVAAFYAPTFAALRLLSTTPPLVRAVGAASVWIAFEALRAADPVGNTWALLGHGLAGVPLLREALAFGGVWTLGWGAALCGAAIGVALQPDIGMRDAFRCTRLAFLAPVVLALLGASAHYGDRTVAPIQPLRVAVVQAEIPSRDLWDPAKRMQHWNAYLEATEALKPGSADVVVWPESAAPFLLDADAGARQQLRDLATRLDASLLLGAPRTEPSGGGRATLRNSVYFFEPGADQPRTYDKRRLLPFVETAPAGTGSEAMPYGEGNSLVLFDVNGWQLAPLICFESLYPEYAREAVLAGADLLVNVSNDAWFAGGAGPEQHYAMSVPRTLELRRAMVRASNGGISAAIGADGEEIGFPIRRQKGTRIYEIPPPPRRITMTATYGNIIVWFAAGFALLALAIALRPVRAST